MEVGTNPQGNGPERTADIHKAIAHARERIDRAHEVRSSELAAARARVERVKAKVVERAHQMQRAGKTVQVDPDRLDLSATARAVLDEGVRERAHEARLAELEAAYEEGKLNDNTRVARAASRLLGGE